jgi:hypothetical protein
MLNPTLFVAAGAIPLIIATSMSFLAGSQGNDAPLPVSSESDEPPRDYTAALTTAKEQQTEVNDQAQPLIQQLQKLDLFASETFPENSDPAVPAGTHAKLWLSEMQKSWPAARIAHDGLVGVIDAHQSTSSSDDRLKNLQDKQEKLKAYSSEAPSNPFKAKALRGGTQFARHVDGLCVQLKTQIKNEESLISAKGRLNLKDYEGCLVELEKMDRTDLSSETEQFVEADEIQRRAGFWKHWKAEPPVTDVSATAMAARDTLRQSSPAAKLTAEIEKLARMDKQLVRLNCERAITELRTNPPKRVRDYLDRVRPLLELCSDKRPTVRTLFEQWLESKLPTRIVPANGLVTEALKKDGTLVAGVYEKAPGGVLWYKYWTTQASRKQKGGDVYDESFFVPQQIEKEPRDPVIVTCVKGLNDFRNKLVKSLDSQEKWEEFKNFCSEQEARLDEYSASGGLKELERAIGEKVPDPEFAEARQLAEQVIVDWEQISSLLTN